MAVSNRKAVFQNDIQEVWNTVTSLENYAWRSDLSKIEILNEKQFVEYTKEGYATTFTITVVEPCKRWEFDMENDNMKGHWTGRFTQKGEQTEIDFTEDAAAKNMDETFRKSVSAKAAGIVYCGFGESIDTIMKISLKAFFDKRYR